MTTSTPTTSSFTLLETPVSVWGTEYSTREAMVQRVSSLEQENYSLGWSDDRVSEQMALEVQITASRLAR